MGVGIFWVTGREGVWEWSCVIICLGNREGFSGVEGVYWVEIKIG